LNRNVAVVNGIMTPWIGQKASNLDS